MKGNKILVLGIGPSQVDLIKKCKEKEMIVYAIAHSENGPGKELVDEFKLIDIKDHDAVEEYAKEKNIDFIFTLASEVGVKTTAIVSERLNLPKFISSESADILSNKTKWRKHLGDIEGNVKFISANNLKDLESWSNYPAMIKPVDSSGQRGVFKVENFDDVQKVFEGSLQHSRSGAVMLEEFIDGPEISVNSFMLDGELKYALISDRISHEEYSGGIIKKHIIPSKYEDEKLTDKINTLVEQVNKKSGFLNGHVYFQIKLHNNEEPRLVEYTPRFDGCHMWRLIKHSRNIDLVEKALEWLATGNVETFEDQDNGGHTLWFISDHPGTIVDKNNYDIPESTEYLEWYYDNGDKVNKVTGLIEKVGYYIVQNNS